MRGVGPLKESYKKNNSPYPPQKVKKLLGGKIYIYIYSLTHKHVDIGCKEPHKMVLFCAHIIVYLTLLPLKDACMDLAN